MLTSSTLGCMPSKFLSFAATRTIWWQEHPGTSRVYILDEEDFSGKRSSRPKVCQRAFPCLHTRFADGFRFTRSEYFGQTSQRQRHPEVKMLNSKAHHTLALLALDLTTGGFNEIILAAVSQLLVAILPKHGHLSSILVSYKFFTFISPGYTQWNQLRHQEHNQTGGEEHLLRIFSFSSLAHFFVTFINIKLVSDDAIVCAAV